MPAARQKLPPPDGFEITVFYTRDLIPENKAYDPPFKNLDGLPLEYEFTRRETCISGIHLHPSTSIRCRPQNLIFQPADTGN